MNNNHKLRNPRKHSNSRQHTSNLKSNSKSNEKFKQRSDSKLLIKLKLNDNISNSEQDHSFFHTQLNRNNKLSQKKITAVKQANSMNQYYNAIQGKSKSKRKLDTNDEEFSRSKFLNNIYMHKEDKDNLTTILCQNEQKIMSGCEKSKQQDEKGYIINNNLINKIKSLQKAGGFDSNGKYVMKQSKKHTEISKHTESQHHTISLYEQDKKKDGNRKKQRNRKQIKNRIKKQQKLGYGNTKISNVKSADKMYKKKEIKEVNSPNFITKNDKFNDTQFTVLYDNQQKAKVKQNLKLQMTLMSNRTSKTILSEQTQPSPPQPINLHEPSIILDDLIKELNEDNRNRLNFSKLKNIYAHSSIQRLKSIELISKISSNMNIRRQSHSLAIYYIDKYMLTIQKEVTPKQLKLIALTALLLATKIDDGIMSRKLCHQYINHMGSILNINKTPIKNKSLQKNKEMNGLSSKQSSSNNLRGKGQIAISELGVSKQQIKFSQRQQLSSYKQLAIIHSLQLDILTKFSFKLIQKSSTYWIDILTALWDNYVCQEQLSFEEYLLFRNFKNKKNISHCYQIIELLSLDLEHYKYSFSSLVLSAMYLIIRMRLQEQKQNISEIEIYSKYINDLSKSTNLIFYDKVGINELFGDFLIQFQMNLSDIIECIQFVGKNLITSFKIFTFQSKNRVHNSKYEYQLSIYEQSCQIFKAKGIQY